MNGALHKPHRNSTIFIVLALWIFWGFGYETLFKRLMTDVEGTVISAEDIPSPLAPARHGTEYILRSPTGRPISYIAGSTDASLSRNIPVGSYIKKRRWHLSYERDGQQVDDFSISFYLASLAMAVGCLVWGVRLSRHELEVMAKRMKTQLFAAKALCGFALTWLILYGYTFIPHSAESTREMKRLTHTPRGAAIMAGAIVLFSVASKLIFVDLWCWLETHRGRKRTRSST
jgi:hypothetical protein